MILSNINHTHTPFLDLDKTLENDSLHTQIYNKNLDFFVVSFPFLDGDIPETPFYDIYIS